MLVLLTVLAVFTFAPPPSAPPSIAEVAPQALKQITEAPIEQAVSAGGRTGEIPVATPKSSPTQEVATPFRCVGALPRQIEDPQSPPCVPMWTGDNGGATYQGVTKDTITVVVPDFPTEMPALKAYEGFFNRRFQFYGRKLKLIGIVMDQQTTGDEASAQQYLAAKADQEYRAFASLATVSFQGTVYYRELARRKVLAITNYPQYTQRMLEGLSPYVWQYGISLDRLMSMTGDWMCARVVGGAADFSTDPNLIGKPRKLGLFYQDAAGNRFDLAPLEQALRGCGASFAVVKHLPFNDERGANSGGAQYMQDPTVKSAVIDMKDRGVTSILCLCDTVVLGPVAQVAAQQSYFPEWQVATYNHQEVLYTQQQHNIEPQERAGMFGLTFIPRLLRAADDPAMWALMEQDPSVFVPSRDDTSVNRQLVWHSLYRTLLLLASGIQLAGPTLTPETFAAGLHRTPFPNPEHRIQAGKVGFLGGSYSMTLDAAEYWWSNSAPSPYLVDPSLGTWCYVDGGARRDGEEWPGQPAFFQTTACDSGR